MKPHVPPALDAPEAVWRAYLTDQLAHLHECFETKLEDADEKVEAYHIQNQNGRAEDRALVLAAIDELKQEASALSMWQSAEDKKREQAAWTAQGESIERERWLRWWRRAQGFMNTVWDWAGKPGIAAAAMYVATRLL